MKGSVALRASAALVAVVVVGAGLVALAPSSSDEDSTVVGVFADASPLVSGSEVRAAGVKVGKVKEISLENGKARVTLDVDPLVLPLHRDAKLMIRPVDLLGEHYVQLDAGSPDQPYLSPTVISERHTSKREDLQDLLDTFDDPTSTALAAVLTTLGEGMHGSGSEAADAIKALAPAMRDTEALGEVLSQQNDVLNRLLERADPIADALATQDGDLLDKTISSADRVLATTAANQKALDQTLAELPTTVRAARRTLRELAGVSGAAVPTLKSLRPVTDDLSEISRELERTAAAADPALTTLRPVLKHADALLKQAAPAVAELRRSGPTIRSAAKRLRPVGDVLLDEHLSDLMNFVRYWALSTNDRDALSHYFRGVFHVTPRTLQDLVAGSPAGKHAPDIASALPSTPKPNLPKLQLPKLPGRSGGNNVTGLTQEQERSMLGQLLGGL